MMSGLDFLTHSTSSTGYPTVGRESTFSKFIYYSLGGRRNGIIRCLEVCTLKSDAKKKIGHAFSLGSIQSMQNIQTNSVKLIY